MIANSESSVQQDLLADTCAANQTKEGDEGEIRLAPVPFSSTTYMTRHQTTGRETWHASVQDKHEEMSHYLIHKTLIQDKTHEHNLLLSTFSYTKHKCRGLQYSNVVQ